MSEIDDNWLIDLINSENPKCFRCGENYGVKCDVVYSRSNRTKVSVLCEKCADIVVRQHDCKVIFTTLGEPEFVIERI